MSMPVGDVTQAQLDMLAGGDASQSVGGEVSQQEVNSNIPVEDNNAAQSASTDNMFLSADSVYADLPTAFRDAKTLDKVIADVNARHQKAIDDAAARYKDYEAFLNVPAENLAYAHQIFQMMDSKDGAEQVFNALAKTYGFQTAAAAVQQMQQVQQQIEQEPEELSPEQQEIKALKERLDQMQGFQDTQLTAFNQAVAAENKQRFENEMDQAFGEIYAIDPTLSTDQMRNDRLVASVVEAYDRDLRNGGRTPIRNLVQQAFQDQRAYNQYLYDKLMSQNQNLQRGPAPIVMNPTGSNPGGEHAFNVHDAKQREAEFVARLQALNNS